MSSPVVRMLDAPFAKPRRSLVASGTLLLVCTLLGCLSQNGPDENGPNDNKQQEKWVVVRFEITIDPFTNEPAHTVSFSPQTLNVLKWESTFFTLQDPEPRLLEYYGAVGLGPVGKDAETVSLLETLPPGVNASFKEKMPEITEDEGGTLLEWTFPSVTQAMPGSCSCSSNLFPEVVEYFLDNPPIKGRQIRVESRNKPDIRFASTISGIEKATRVSVVFSFRAKDAQGKKVLSLISASNDWQTREEGDEFLLGASFGNLSEKKRLEFSLNVSAQPGLSLISFNQETVTGKKISSSGIIIESSNNFFGNLGCSAEGFKTERLNYTREAYVFPELVVGS